MQALMLAAGMGKRLGKYTGNNTKCMLDVAGKKLIDRAIDAVKKANIDKFVFVIGYKGQNLKEYILNTYKNSGIEFVFIDNKDYAISNNIYSFYIAKDYLENDDTIMLESDLIFDDSLILKLKENDNKNVAVVAKYESWMDGTVVTCDSEDNIIEFIEKKDMDLNKTDSYFKTVNIYKFSKEFAKNVYIPFVEAYMKAYGLNSYYETVLKAVVHMSKESLKAMYMDDMPWYEIDDAQDLDIATALFSCGIDKYNYLINRDGGYWRYSKLIDFTNFSNPFYPSEKMLNKLRKDFNTLLINKPSCDDIYKLNVERIFNINEEFSLVSNSVNDFIVLLQNSFKVKVHDSLELDVEEIKESVKNNKITYIKNPTINNIQYVDKKAIAELIESANQNNNYILLDETFIDYVENSESFFNTDDLIKYKNLIVIKDIGLNYGVQGLNLSVLVCANTNLLENLRSLMKGYRINSFAEYFLQLFNLFTSDYKKSLQLYRDEVKRVKSELKKNKRIKLLDLNISSILIDVIGLDLDTLKVKLLEDYHILVKVVVIKGHKYLYLPIKSIENNNLFINALSRK